MRTSFWQKIKDCFTVLFVNEGVKKQKRDEDEDEDKDEQKTDDKAVGIFDYLTLGIPLFWLVIFDRCSNFSPNINFWLLRLLAQLIVFLIEIVFFALASVGLVARFAFASIVTLAMVVLPVIPLVHAISRYLSREPRENLGTIPMFKNENSQVESFADIKARLGEPRKIQYTGDHELLCEWSTLRARSLQALTPKQTQAICYFNIDNAQRKEEESVTELIP